MVAVHSPNNRPFSQIPIFGIALGGDSDQTHLGVAFRRNSDNAMVLLHLGFHFLLKLDHPIPEQDYCWVDSSDFSDEEKTQFAIWLEKIWNVNLNRVPYGLRLSREPLFDTSGVCTPSRVGDGMTCATFVMEIFRNFALPIVDVDSWQSRPEEDAGFQRKIVDTMEEHKLRFGISDEHIAEQRAAIGTAVRFKPEEVAAAYGLYAGDAVQFLPAATNGALVKADMLRLLAVGCGG